MWVGNNVFAKILAFSSLNAKKTGVYKRAIVLHNYNRPKKYDSQKHAESCV